MSHSLPLLTTLSTALALALILGFISLKLKLPTLVGYLLAGVLLGPFTPGYVANAAIAAELAEIGVILLMFGVGLHFSWDNLLQTRKIALPGAILQIVVATLMGIGVGLFWGWNFENALILGLALSVASTVVLIRGLESQNLLESINGQIAVGWLIIEDLAMVIILVFLPFIDQWFEKKTIIAQAGGLSLILGLILLKFIGFIVVMLFLGRWVLPRLLWQVFKTNSRELFTLCIIAVAVSIAFGASKLFGISLALGAFFAGMIIRESKFSRRAAEDSLPFRDAFAVLFFVSVGMLFDPHIFIKQPIEVLVVVGIIIIGKSIAAALLVLAFKYPLNTALTISASLAQIGEFSFILANQGVYLGLLSTDGQGLVVAGALISISLNPFLFKMISPLQNWLRNRSAWVRYFEQPADPLLELPVGTKTKYLTGHIILSGYSYIGQEIAKILKKNHINYVVIDEDHDLIEQLRKSKNKAAVLGKISNSSTLIQAHIATAGMLVLTSSDAFDIRATAKLAHKLNPKIELAIHAEDKEEIRVLKKEIKGTFFLSEEELVIGMIVHILTRFGISS
jgi:CPA2 family monovalent cation:H+ antiporter-2